MGQKERDEREIKRKEDEFKAKQASYRMDKINTLAKTKIGAQIIERLTAEELGTLDTEKILDLQVLELEKEKKELQVRLKKQEKNVDHIERAKRQEEIPLLLKQFDEFKEEARQVWEEQERERIETEKAQRENDVTNRDRMQRMIANKDVYLDGLLKERKNIFEKKLEEFNAMLSDERKQRLEKRKEDRIEERRRKWMQERRDEEQRRRDEIAKRERTSLRKSWRNSMLCYL